MKKEMIKKIIDLQKNVIINGNIGSGKTKDVLFPIVDNLIDKKESLFILDAKEEYLERFYDKLKSNDYNTIIINLRDMDKSEGWNPFEYPAKLYRSDNKDKAQEYLEKIGSAIFYEDSTQDPFWTNTGSNLFTGLALALIEDAKDEEINFSSINNLINGFDRKFGNLNYTTQYFNLKDTNSPSYIFAASTINAPQETRSGILSVVRTKIRVFSTREKLCQLLSKTTFDFENVGKKPTAIIMIARDDNRVLNDIAAMFIEQLYPLLVDSRINNRFNLILDNFDVIDRVNDLTDILSSCITRNIKAFIVTRSKEELEKKYGNYINCLSANISINGNNINTSIDNVSETFEKVENEDNYKSKVEYPTLKSNPIKLFDYLRVVEITNIRNISSTAVKGPSVFDDYLKKIDEQIAKLEQEIKEDEEKAKK